MSGRVSSIGTRIPQPSVPFVTPGGGIAREWLYYFVALLNRTGGDAGISATILQQQVITLQQQFSALFAEVLLDDLQAPQPRIGLAIGDVFGSEPEPTSVAAATLLAMSTDDAPAPSLNPFLAALIVADLT